MNKSMLMLCLLGLAACKPAEVPAPKAPHLPRQHPLEGFGVKAVPVAYKHAATEQDWQQHQPRRQANSTLPTASFTSLPPLVDQSKAPVFKVSARLIPSVKTQGFAEGAVLDVEIKN